MSKFKNKKKDKYLLTIPTESLDQDTNNISRRMKFNFSFIDETQGLGLNITKLSKDQSNKLITKLKEYSRESFIHWERMKIGSGNHRNSVYVNYITFPNHSNFTFPKNVPHQVEWGRFRLESGLRLVGFTIPNDYHDKIHKKSGCRFDINTFYIVFFDHEHNFYPTKKK